MKKIFTIATVAALGAIAGTAVEWNTNVPNLVSGAEVTVSSRPDQAGRITDNDNGSRWQAIAKAYEVAPDWVIVDLGETKEVNFFEIRWEASHPSAYSVYVSEEAIPYSACAENEEYNVIDSEWLSGATAVANRVMEGESSFTDEFSLENAVTMRYMLVYCTEYNNNAKNYGSSIFEIRAGKIASVTAPASLLLETTDVYDQQATTATVSVFSAGGEKLELSTVSNVTLSCSVAEAVEITGGEDGVYTIKGLIPGHYTLTVTADTEEENLSSTTTFNVLIDWTKVTNIATGKPTIGRIKDTEAEYEHAPSCATDGNEETYYTYDGGWGGGDSWVIVDLGTDHIINGVGVSYGKDSGGRFAVSFGGAEAAQPESDLNWNNDGAVEGWENSEIRNRITESVNTYIPAAPVRARYVAVRDKDNPNGKPEIREIFIAGEEAAKPEPTEINFAVDAPAVIIANDKITLSSTVYDQYGVTMNDIEVEYYANGTKLASNEFTPTETGTYTLEARCGEVSATEEIEVTFDGSTKANPSATAIKNGTETKNPFTAEVTWSNEEVGQTLEITLEKAHALKLIRIRWEAACPSDYTVDVTDKNDNSTTVLTVTGRKFTSGVHPVDHIIHMAAAGAPRRVAGESSSASLENVKKITITPTAKDHGWPIRLLGLDAYGEEIDDEQTGLESIESASATVDVYNLQGVAVRRGVARSAALDALPSGIYIVDGKKIRK